MIFRWIFGAAGVGFLGALGAILAMHELPLKEQAAAERAISG